MLRHVALLWVAPGRPLAPCVLWLMYTHGLTARPVVLVSGPAGWAVAPAQFVGSGVGGGGGGWLERFFEVGLPVVPPPLWCRFGVGGFNLPVAVGAGGLGFLWHPRWGGWHRQVCAGRCPVACVVLWVWPLVSAWWAGVVASHGCGRLSFLFLGKRRLDLVGLTVSVHCLDAVVCCDVMCCAVRSFAVLRCASLRCSALCPAPLCRAVPCCGMSCLAVLWCVAACCAVQCRAVQCRGVQVAGRRAALRCAVVCCAAFRCAVLCCVALRRVMLCCAVRWVSCIRWCGVGWRRLLALLCGPRVRHAGSVYVAGWWLVGGVWRGAVCCVGAAEGLGVPSGPLGPAVVRGAALPWGLRLGAMHSRRPCP